MTDIIPKKAIYNILLPQILFTDRFGNTNSYVEMNPSMYIDETGCIQILTRLVNYRKFNNKSFTMNEMLSKSVYVLMTGSINEQNEYCFDFDTQLIQVKYNIPTYNTYWLGLEDIRFINKNTILACIPECNTLGQPSIFKATLHGNIIHSFINCKPNDTEKNWMPFTNHKNFCQVIYSVCPFKLKNVETDVFTEIQLTEEQMETLQNYHGSTNGIRFIQETNTNTNTNTDNNTFLFLIHINQDKTYHKWLLYNADTNEIRISKSFTFFQHSYIEFPISLCHYNNILFVSLGVNDDKAFVVQIDPTVIEFV